MNKIEYNANSERVNKANKEREEGFIAELILEKYLLDELQPSKKKEVEELFESHGYLNEQLEIKKQSNQEILDQYPAIDFSSRILERAKKEERLEKQAKQAEQESGFYFQFLLKPQVVFALLIPVLVFVGAQTLSPEVEIIKLGKERINIKGSFGIKVARLEQKEVVMLKDGDMAKEGDLIQLKYHIPEGEHAVLLSLDGNRQITLHLLQNQHGDTDLQGQRKATLSQSYELDDAPDFERFFMIVSNKDINIDHIKEKVLHLRNPETDRLYLASHYQQYSFLLIKE